MGFFQTREGLFINIESTPRDEEVKKSFIGMSCGVYVITLRDNRIAVADELRGRS